MKDALFDLISALTRSEKRYFKLLASRHTIGDENNYVTLFNFIEKQNTYDEDLIFQKFDGESFLNNFSITKKRLYDNILNALEAYHLNSSEEAIWSRQLHSAEILMGKTLYDQAKKIISTVEKQASKRENNLILQKVLRLKSTYHLEFGAPIFINDRKRKSNDHIAIENEGLYGQLIKNLNSYRLSGVLNEIAIPCNLNLTIENQLLIRQVRLLASFANDQLEEAKALITENMHLFAGNPDLVKKHYFTILENYRLESLTLLKLGDYKLAKEKLQCLKELMAENENQRQLIASMSQLLSIEIELYGRKYEQLGHLVEKTELKSLLAPNKELLKEIQFKLACSFLLLGNHSKALAFTNQLFHDVEVDHIDQQSGIIHLLDCIIHYELKHYDYLQYAIKNSMRQLKAKNQFLLQHKLIFTVLTKLCTTNRKLDQEDLLLELKKEIMSNKLHNNQKFFPIEDWLDQKIRLLAI